MAEPKHFLDIEPFDEDTLRDMFALSRGFKDGTAANMRPLEGKFLALVFEKPSTRTRISFDVGMRQLGGETVHLTHSDAQLGQGVLPLKRKRHKSSNQEVPGVGGHVGEEMYP